MPCTRVPSHELMHVPCAELNLPFLLDSHGQTRFAQISWLKNSYPTLPSVGQFVNTSPLKNQKTALI